MKAPKNKRLDRREAHRRGDDIAQRDQRYDLECAADQRDPAGPEQVADRQLETNGEEQEDEADIGQRGDRLHVGDGARGVRPDDQAGNDEAEDGRLAKPNSDGAADGGRDQG